MQYCLEQYNQDANKYSVVKVFKDYQECLAFCQKQDKKLNRIHCKQQNSFKNYSRFLFFNVWASNKDFFQTDKQVINWYSMAIKSKSYNVHFSIKPYVVN